MYSLDHSPPSKTEAAKDEFSAFVHTLKANWGSRDKVRTQSIGVSGTLPPIGEGIQWIHVPVNNLDWVNSCFKICGQFEMHPKITDWKVRPVFSRVSKAGSPAESTWPEHARHLEPSCTQGTYPYGASKGGSTCLPPLTVYLPYMSLMEYGDYLLYSHVRERPSYPRRTLDQFYYPALGKTGERDKDQTISKWSGAALEQGGRSSAATDSAIIMVDQFWCWIIDNKTIITSFPSETNNGCPSGVKDLYQSIMIKLFDDPKPFESVSDMYSLLVEESTSYMFSHINKSSLDILEIYRWVTSKKAASQIDYIQQYQKNAQQNFQQGCVNGGPDEGIFEDLKLVLEIVDIIEELRMIQHLLCIQEDVIKSSYTALESPALEPLTRSGPQKDSQLCKHFQKGFCRFGNKCNFQHVLKGPQKLTHVISEIASIIDDAAYTHTMLLNLLNIKSSVASLAEAQSAKKEAQAATTQGRAVMLFTIITVIFLPLSFFTSYYGQNVKELTGDENNPSTWDLWRVAMPITIVVIVVALLIALFITQPKKRRQKLLEYIGRKPDNNNNKVGDAAEPA